MLRDLKTLPFNDVLYLDTKFKSYATIQPVKFNMSHVLNTSNNLYTTAYSTIKLPTSLNYVILITKYKKFYQIISNKIPETLLLFKYMIIASTRSSNT